MKSAVTTVLFILCIPTVILSQGNTTTKGERYKGDVDRQRRSDRERIEKIKEQYKSFKDEINGMLKIDYDISIDDPVDIENITDIDEMDYHQSGKRRYRKEFAYVNGAKITLHSEADKKSPVVGHVLFRERVRIIVRSRREDTIRDVTAGWFLIRKDNGDEGWIFGAFIEKNLPDKKKTIDSLDKHKTISHDFVVPVAGKITSRFGYRVHPVTKRRISFHKGIDIAAREGTPVRASAGGIVRRAGFNRNGYGNLIVIEHDKELSTYYGHLSRFTVQAGQRVKKGDLVGYVGSTGRVTGPHLHFEVRKGKTAFNPELFLP